jgi:hypothetical protein
MGDRHPIVIGVGINLGRQAFPPELTRDITCLEELAAAPVAREPVLLDVLTQIERRVAACERSGLSELFEEFRQHDALRDQRVTVSAARELAGVARGVDEEGRLLLETEGVVLPVSSARSGGRELKPIWIETGGAPRPPTPGAAPWGPAPLGSRPDGYESLVKLARRRAPLARPSHRG